MVIPQPERSAEGLQADEGGLLQQAVFGFKYIFARPSLLGLQMVFFFGNLFSGMVFTVMAPMLLARSGQNSVVLGTVESFFAVGGILGGVLMSIWGGFKRRVNGVLLGWMVTSLAAVWLGMGQSLSAWIPAAILSMLVSPLINGSNQAIWQSKVAPDLQGRVFSARRLIAWFTNPLSPILAGTLADFILEPAMRANGSLPGLFGGLVGSGPGAGMGLLMVFCGLAGLLVGLGGYLIPVIRQAEDLLPDHAPSGAESATAA